MSCQHEQFASSVKVGRLTNGDGEVKGYLAEVKIRCTECDHPFEFLGLEAGLDLHGARVSLDGQEARLAIIPKGTRPNPLQRITFDVQRIDA